MKGIQSHPWYLQDLPDGVMEMNNELPLPGDDVQVDPLNPLTLFYTSALSPPFLPTSLHMASLEAASLLRPCRLYYLPNQLITESRLHGDYETYTSAMREWTFFARKLAS